MDTAKSITITEPEAKAIIARLRHSEGLHAIELGLASRLIYEVRELDRELAHAADQAQFEFDFGDV